MKAQEETVTSVINENKRLAEELQAAYYKLQGTQTFNNLTSAVIITFPGQGAQQYVQEGAQGAHQYVQEGAQGAHQYVQEEIHGSANNECSKYYQL